LKEPVKSKVSTSKNGVTDVALKAERLTNVLEGTEEPLLTVKPLNLGGPSNPNGRESGSV